jgi:hypothetical protein
VSDYSDAKVAYDRLSRLESREQELLLKIADLQMVCRRLAAAKSLETRDRVAEQCHHLFAGNPLRKPAPPESEER